MTVYFTPKVILIFGPPTARLLHRVTFCIVSDCPIGLSDIYTEAPADGLLVNYSTDNVIGV